MGLRTPIYDVHFTAGAKMVDFNGWDMPIHYGSQIAEHHLVRQQVGVCDISHMTVIDLSGPECQPFLSRLLANDVAKLNTPGKALYSAMLNTTGGILDDLMTYRLPEGYRLVVNCATREKDLAWLRQQIGHFACALDERSELAILAIQGPDSLIKLQQLLPTAQADLVNRLGPFIGGFCGDWFIARTGYTGELGVEIMLPAEQAAGFWQTLLAAGIRPIGLGARDTLRLEAGMNLYGSDMDEAVTPFEANMTTTVAMRDNRDFIGRSALMKQLELSVHRELIGLVMRERGVLRAHYPVYSEGQQVGEVTSGAFSPTLQHAIALARVKTVATSLKVGIRNRRVKVHRVKVPFVRYGKQVYKLDEE